MPSLLPLTNQAFSTPTPLLPHLRNHSPHPLSTSRLPIPHQISPLLLLGNLTSLQAIDLSSNNITGVIPSSLGSLEDLMSLHLQSNKFEGDIPISLQNLLGLVTMDLGNNFFTGTIPF
ncbi:putative non-specific serine/threonine protein kinase [Helianthus debilis subsp. tardiflorus]